MNQYVLVSIIQRALEERGVVNRNSLRTIGIAVDLAREIAEEYPKVVSCPCCGYPRCGHDHTKLEGDGYV